MLEGLDIRRVVEYIPREREHGPTDSDRRPRAAIIVDVIDPEAGIVNLAVFGRGELEPVIYPRANVPYSAEGARFSWGSLGPKVPVIGASGEPRAAHKRRGAPAPAPDPSADEKGKGETSEPSPEDGRR